MRERNRNVFHNWVDMGTPNTKYEVKKSGASKRVGMGAPLTGEQTSEDEM